MKFAWASSSNRLSIVGGYLANNNTVAFMANEIMTVMIIHWGLESLILIDSID